MKRLLLLLLLSPVILLAQKQGQGAIDSMLKKLPVTKEDTNKVKLLNALSFSYSYTDPDEGIKYGQQALGLATKLDWQSGLGRANNCLGINYYGKSDNIRALSYFSKAVSTYEAVGDQKMIAGVLNNMSAIYADQCNYTKALDCLFKALKITEQNGDKVSNKNSLSIIGNVYFQENDYPKALEYYFRSLKISEEIGNKDGIAANMNGIGNVYATQKDYPKALEYYNKDLEIVKETGNKRGIADVNINLGCTYAAQNDHVKALEYFFTALKIHEETGQKRDAAIVYMNIGTSYASLKNYTLAIAYEEKSRKIAEEIGDKYVIVQDLLSISAAYISLAKDRAAESNIKVASNDQPDWIHVPIASIPNERYALLRAATDSLQRGLLIAKEINTTDLIQSCYESLTDASKLNGNYEQALEYSDSVRAIKDSIFLVANKIKINNLDTRRELDLKQKQIELDQLDLAKKRNENIFFIAAIILLIVIGILFINRQVLKHKKIEAEKKHAESLQYIAEKDKDLATYLLNERIKELSTIYEVNRILLNEDWPQEKVFQEIVSVLPPGWQYPDVCAAKIVLDNEEYTSANYGLSYALQRTDFTLTDNRKGYIEVAYLEQKPQEAEGPFLKEERDLINTIAELISVFFDRALQRRSLVQSENKFRNLVEQSMVGVYILQNGHFVYVNPRIMEDSGYSEAELLSSPATRFIYEEDINIVKKKIEERLSGETTGANYEVRFRRKNGEILWVEIFGAATVYQGAPAIIGATVNITDKKIAFDELRRSEANLKSIFEHTQVSYLLLDVNFNIRSLNKRMYDLYIELADIYLKPGDNLVELILPEKRETVRDTYTKVVRENKLIEYETSYTTREGQKYFLASVMPIDSRGEVIGLCVSSLDITRLKHLELERQRIIADLLQRNKELEEFGQIVSHNVRGPLSTILGFCDLINSEMSEPELEFMTSSISFCAKRLDSVIKELNNILVLKKDINEPKIAIDLNKLVEDVKYSLKTQVEDNAAIVHYDFSAADSVITLRSYIHNIFSHLISNSIKYHKAATRPEIKIISSQHNGTISISFEDNGIGIDLDKYGAQVFKLNKRFTNTVEGKGLGLYMVKTLIELLNGRVSVRSKLGSGTTFIIELPVKTADEFVQPL